MGQLIVVALGGNALLRRGEPPTAEIQRRNVAQAADAIAQLAREHDVVVTHGNGPQIGLLALQSAALPTGQTFPLDVLGAESEGMIGYVIEQELSNRLSDKNVATLLTQVTVDPDDPAFAAPTKPIGRVYCEDETHRMARDWGWVFGEDGEGYRRVVPSPRPRDIRELPAIKILIDAGVVVVCAGGGGIPVVLGEDGTVKGIEAVIDKDASSALLARELNAAWLLLLTDVGAVFADWPAPNRRPIRAAGAAAFRELAFDQGSMGPKVMAACEFVEQTGHAGAIGALKDAAAIIAGEAGTRVCAEGEIRCWPETGKSSS